MFLKERETGSFWFLVEANLTLDGSMAVQVEIKFLRMDDACVDHRT